jgi:hypothetical protein
MQFVAPHMSLIGFDCCGAEISKPQSDCFGWNQPRKTSVPSRGTWDVVSNSVALMATWKERRAWRREFKSLGIRQVKAREAGSIWHGEKQQAARRWLREHELMPYVIAMLLAIAMAAIIAFFGGWLGSSSA